MKNITFVFPEGLIELDKLQSKHKGWNKNWKETPLSVQEKMTALALANGGIDALTDEPAYLQYLSRQSSELYHALISGNKKDIDRAYEKLSWLTGLLHDFYSKNTRRVTETKRKEGMIYVMVELYLRKHIKSTTMEACRHVLNELGGEVNHDLKYIQTRYYKFRLEFKNMAPEDVITKFHLPLTT